MPLLLPSHWEATTSCLQTLGLHTNTHVYGVRVAAGVNLGCSRAAHGSGLLASCFFLE